MLASVSTLFAVILVVGCGQSVSSSPVVVAGGQIVQPGPNTYTVGAETKSKVELRRVPANRVDHELVATSSSKSWNGTSVSFGELTSTSLISSYIKLNITNPDDDLLIFDFEQYGYSTYTFVEAFDTSADGQSGGNVQLATGTNNGIGTRRIIIIITAVRPGAAVSVFITTYAEDLVYGGPSFLNGRLTPGMEYLYTLVVQSANVDPNAILTSTHSNQVQGEIGYIEGRKYVPQGSVTLLDGGVGTSNFTISYVSGVGANLLGSLAVYGVPRR